MSSPKPLFIHPLLDAGDRWSGYTVELVPGEPDNEPLQYLCASPLLSEFDQRHPWFVPVIANATEPDSFARAVFLFPAQPRPQDEEALNLAESRIRQAAGKVGLLASPNCKLPSSGTWNYLLIGAAHARTLSPYSLIGMATRTGIVATQVFSHQDRQWLLTNSCQMSTDEFLLTFSAENSAADTSRLKMLELLGLVANDADTGALENIFRQESKLSYSLLRLVNSAAIAPRTPITSFAQAINLLGRRQLQRWLQLLVYADPNNDQNANPLLLKAAARGRLLELLAPRLADESGVEQCGDTAFMIGTFSLLDVLLNMPMPEILMQLPLTEIVHAALATRSGPLGQLLNAVDSAEAGTPKSAAQKLAELGIGGDAYIDAQLQALSWAARIRPA